MRETFRRITRSDLPARTQDVDHMAVAMIAVFSATPGIGQTPQPSPPRNELATKPAAKNTEELAIRALSAFTWNEGQNSSGARTERGQNLLHTCAIGNYRKLLQFLFERGFDGEAKRQAVDDTGRTALRISKDMGREDITRMLSPGSKVARRSSPKSSGLPTTYVLCFGPHRST